MSSGLSNFCRHFGWFIAAVCLAVRGVLYAADPQTQGVPIEFSEPGFGLMSTNLEQMRVKVFSEENLGESVERPNPLVLNERPSANPLAPMRSGSLVPNRRTREQLERNSEWSFSAEDMVQNYIALQIIKSQNPGLDRKQMNSLLLTGSAFGLMPGGNLGSESGLFDLSGRQRTDPGMDAKGFPNPYSRGVFDNLTPDADLKKAGLNPGRSAYSDMYRPGDFNNLTPEAIRAQKVREDQHEQFKKILGFQSPAPGFRTEDLFKPPVATTASGNKPLSTAIPGQGYAAKPLLNANNPTVQRPLAPLAPLTPDIPHAPGQQSRLDPAPVFTPVAPSVVPKQTFTAPKRSF